jgi:hypothetical protein
MGQEYPYFALWRLLNADAISTPEALRVLPAECRRQHFIRRTKEEMVTLDGRPLYPVRQCDTLGFDLSSEEHALYEDATTYIRSLYNTAPGLNRSAARLVMSVFQRRLASSTAAMRESLQRRSERLARLIALVQAEGVDALRRYQAEAARKAQDQGDIFENKTADEESTEVGEDHEAAEDAALGVSTAGTLADLMIERDTVDGLVRQADKVLARGNESKFKSCSIRCGSRNSTMRRCSSLRSIAIPRTTLLIDSKRLGLPARWRGCMAGWTIRNATDRWSCSVHRLWTAARNT